MWKAPLLSAFLATVLYLVVTCRGIVMIWPPRHSVSGVSHGRNMPGNFCAIKFVASRGCFLAHLFSGRWGMHVEKK